MKSGEANSADRKYRYKLVRHWNLKIESVMWVMLNPGTADTRKDDPTIGRCIAFAMRHGCGGIAVYNLFAFRTA